MAINFDHGKISITAKLVAYCRQFSDIPFAQEIAKLVHAEEAVQKLTQESGFSSNINEQAPHFEARYKSIVSLIAKSGLHQILELASGFSLRGLAMTDSDPKLTYIESDLPDLTSEKTRLIRELRTKLELKNRGNHHLAIANALKINELRTACAPLDRNKKLIVVNEGLLRYLSTDEIDTIAANVHALLNEFGGGIWITPDFSLKTDMNDNPGLQRFGQLVKIVTGRDHTQSMFKSEKELESFFTKHGFKSSVHYQFDESPELVTIKKLGISPDNVSRMRTRFKVWTLSSNLDA